MEKTSTLRHDIHDLIQSIAPLDTHELQHQQFVLQWIASGAELFRLQKPDIPPIHLVSYAVLVADRKILLTAHKKAGLWLPPGGHVEPGEHPQIAAQREAKEELNIDADFLLTAPLFLSVTKTVREIPGHTDVSLWYVFKGNISDLLQFDTSEFTQVHWFSIEEIPQETGPHMFRFIQKLKGFL